MNKSLIELEDNHGISIDECGSATVITKDKLDYNFEEILKKENKLELLNNNLCAAKREYNDTKNDLKWGRIFNILILTVTFLIGFTYSLVFAASIKMILICGGFAGFSKLIATMISGLPIKNKKRLKKLNQKIIELENKIPTLEKELNKIKDQVNYIALSDISSKNDYQELPFDNLKYTQDKKSKGKVKILKLTSY